MISRIESMLGKIVFVLRNFWCNKQLFFLNVLQLMLGDFILVHQEIKMQK